MTGDGRQNPNLSFEQLHEEAEEAAPLLRDAGERMIADLRRRHPGLFDNIHFELGPMKEKDGALDKIARDYRGNVSEIADLVRGQVIVSSAEQIEAIQAYLVQNTATLGIEKAKDHFAVPNDTHFRAINLKARMGNGHVAELRIEHRDMVAVAKQTHTDYKQVQQIDRAVINGQRIPNEAERSERARLMDGIRDVHDEAAHRFGLDTLLNDQGRDVLTRDATERAAREALRAGSAISLTEEFGKRSGMIGGVVVAGALYASDADAGEIAMGAAEAMFPGLSSSAALYKGRTAEAAMRGVEEIPIAGIVLSEAARPVLRGAGFDMDPSIGEMLLARRAEISSAHERFLRVFDGLPNGARDDMPPEAASLAEFKQAILHGENRLTYAFDPADRSRLQQDLDSVQNLYTAQYEELAASGGLAEVEDWIAQRDIPANTPSRVAEPLAIRVPMAKTPVPY